MDSEKLLKQFYLHLAELNAWRGVGNLLGWDQSVNMPPAGAAARAKQQETLSLHIQKRRTDPDFIKILEELAQNVDSLSDDDALNVRETKRKIDRAKKLPDSFVSEQAHTASLSFTAWRKARPKNDFAATKPYLEKLVELCRQEADLVGYEESPYDALLDIYEPYEKLSTIKPLLLSLANSLKDLLPRVLNAQIPPPPLIGPFPITAQKRLSKLLTTAVGYSYESGRIDEAPHPFQSTIGLGDVRITTRFDENDYLSGITSSLHEAGHALYELGLAAEHHGTPRGSAIALSIHESQSRFWENVIGRSKAFCEYLQSLLPDFFPELALPSPEELWQQLNQIQASPIRVEADELTYSLHIVIRLLLEEQLLTGELGVDELPEAWNALYQEYLGIIPSDLSEGIMQDIHWFSGAIGYFPTYALGNLYAAMMAEEIAKAIPDFETQIRNAEFRNIRTWLVENVHRHGKRYKAGELIAMLSGEALSEKAFLRYLENKFCPSA